MVEEVRKFYITSINGRGKHHKTACIYGTHIVVPRVATSFYLVKDYPTAQIDNCEFV